MLAKVAAPLVAGRGGVLEGCAGGLCRGLFLLEGLLLELLEFCESGLEFAAEL